MTRDRRRAASAAVWIDSAPATEVDPELPPSRLPVPDPSFETSPPAVPVRRGVIHEPRAVPSAFGPADVAERAWLNAAALRPGALVAVSSADGGVGRSTLTAVLGGLLALAVDEPVIAVDMVPAPWGGLGARVGRQSPGTIWDTVRELSALTSRGEVERWVQRGPTGLYALVGETQGGQRRPPRHEEAAAVADRLRGLFPLTLCDLPPALTTGVWRTLAAASAPVLVARATTDSVRHTLRLLTHLNAAGFTRIARDCVLVVMATSPSVPRQVRAVLRQAGDIAGAVLSVPFDPRLALPEPVDPRRLRRRTRTALVHVADAVLQRCAAGRPAPVPQLEERLR